ncbi:DUF3078 domain-containing protein [Bacteroidota bacterium]
MNRLLLVLISILFFSSSSFTQNTEVNSINILTDSVSKSDTIDDLIFSDTISLKDNIKQNSYELILNKVKDSLFFEEPDTIHFVIYNLNKLIENDSLLLNDTIQQAINKLIDYTQSRNIDPVINYLKSSLYAQLIEAKDSNVITLYESIISTVEYLINSVPEDSIRFLFANINNDSVLFNTATSEIDSIHLKLFDNRGEYAVLWIKKSSNDVFELFLDNGVYIEKTKQRKVIDQKLDAGTVIPKLKAVKKANKILPIWEFDGLADIKFNQGYISESWAEGGESSIAALSILKYSADYSYGKTRNLDTDFEYRLGYIQAGGNELQKNDDKFEINVKYGRSAFKNWYYSGLLNFKTQFFKGFDYSNDTIIEISEFLSPAYLVFSIGLDYKPSNKLTVLVSPITSKFTIVADTVNYDQSRFGVGENELIRKEIGAYVKAISKIKLRDNIVLENKVNFFTNYTDNPQNIDVDWEADLAVKLTDYIKLSVNIHFIYDDDVDIPVIEDGIKVGTTKKGQFKELLGVGFTYNF